MKCIGNYAYWIKQEWLDYMTNIEGRSYPSNPKSELDTHSLAPMIRSGRSANSTICIFYDKENTGFNVEPIWSTSKHSEYWFVKLYPGMLQPLHQDELKFDQYGRRNLTHKKYWIPLMDYERGHVFIYEDTLITNYKKGDVYLYDNDQAFHCAGNMGYSTRYSLNLATWD
jgi:hypothetical protein